MGNLANFRQLGLIPTANGKVRYNSIYRGGPFTNLDEEDLEILKNSGIKYIYDLRSLPEVDRAPDKPLASMHWKHMDVLKELQAKDADPAAFTNTQTPDTIHHHMDILYRNLIKDKHAQSTYGSILKDMAQHGQPVYFHCSAGKDRTGVAAMLVLLALEASESSIYEDYLKTNHNLEAIQKKISEGIPSSAANKQGTPPEVLKALLGVEKRYLEASFESILQLSPTFENYFIDYLGLTQLELKNLKQYYTE